jgi:hypothetical protein
MTMPEHDAGIVHASASNPCDGPELRGDHEPGNGRAHARGSVAGRSRQSFVIPRHTGSDWLVVTLKRHGAPQSLRMDQMAQKPHLMRIRCPRRGRGGAAARFCPRGPSGNEDRGRRTDHWLRISIRDRRFRRMAYKTWFTDRGLHRRREFRQLVLRLLDWHAAGRVPSGRQHFLDVAISRMRSIVPHSDDRNTHDIGFNLCTSVPSAYHITGDPWLREVGMHGANQLRSRLVTTRDNAYVPSWPLVHERGSRTVQIDTMPILPLLYWATDESKDTDLREAGEAHAQTTQEHFVRPDYSTVHTVEFDPVSGHPMRKFTFRGYADDSCWSRGQAWAIYGFVATAHATRRIEYLQLAERLAGYFSNRLDATLIHSGTSMIRRILIHRATPRRQLSSHRHCWIYRPSILMPAPEPNGKGVVSHFLQSSANIVWRRRRRTGAC